MFTSYRQRTRYLHVRSQSEPFEQTNQVSGHVDLPPCEAVIGRGWKRVMIVVPTLAEGEQTYHDIVTTRVTSSRKRPLAECMTYGVHAPRYVVSQTDPYQSTPQEPVPEPGAETARTAH